MKIKVQPKPHTMLFILNILILFLLNIGCSNNNEKIKGSAIRSKPVEETLKKESVKTEAQKVSLSEENKTQDRQTILKILNKQDIKSSKDIAVGKEILVEEKTVVPSFFEKIKGIKSKPSVFSTPYGDIEKGASMPEVMNVFGNPRVISFRKEFEVWDYRFNGDKKISVYFLNRKVRNITYKSE